MAKTTKKPKQKTYKQLKNELDKEFSLYIRLRDSGLKGIGKCVTCGALKYFRQADCGHFIKRQYLATRWDEHNCALQCKRCNNFEQGNDVKFEEALTKRYGAGMVELLKQKRDHSKRGMEKFYNFELSMKIAEYKRKNKELMEGKELFL